MSRAVLVVLVLVALCGLVAFVALSATDGPGEPLAEDGPTTPAPRQPAEVAHPAARQVPRPRERSEAAAVAETPSEKPAPAEETTEVRVRVLRPDGNPAAGAVVEWIASRPLSDAERMERLTESHVVPLPGGRARDSMDTDETGHVTLRVARGSSCTIDARLHEDAGSADCKADGERTDVDVRLRPGVMVSGIVRSSDGVPAADASVAVSWPSGIENVKSGPDGRFEAGPLRRAAPATIDIDIRAERADLYPGRLVVKAGESTRDFVLTLNSAVALRGRVIDAEDGKPLGQTWLLFHNGDVKDEQRVFTDKEGRFTARMAPTPRGDMTFIAHERVALRIQDALLVAGVRDLGDVVVERGGTIDGVVVREDGTPAEQPHVTVVSVVVGIAICEARLQAGGAFTGWRVGKGEHELHVTDGPPAGVAGQWDNTIVRGCVAGMENVRVVVLDGPGVIVRLHLPGDARDAAPRPVPSVHATIRPHGDAAPRSVADGRNVHSLRLAAAPGTSCDAEVEAEGFITWRAESVRIPEGKAAVVDAFLVAATPKK